MLEAVADESDERAHIRELYRCKTVSQGLPGTRINNYPCWLTNASKDNFFAHKADWLLPRAFLGSPDKPMGGSTSCPVSQKRENLALPIMEFELHSPLSVFPMIRAEMYMLVCKSPRLRAIWKNVHEGVNNNKEQAWTKIFP